MQVSGNFCSMEILDIRVLPPPLSFKQGGDQIAYFRFMVAALLGDSQPTRILGKNSVT